MIGPSDISGALGGAAGGGGGSAGGAGGPVFIRGQHIDQENAEVGGATCPNLINDRDTQPPIEFIHFGNVHTSLGNRFPHDSYKDNATVKPAAGAKPRPPVPIAKPRGIQFRSALEREAILLATFIESAQTVFAEKEGLLGSLASGVNSLLGQSGGVGSVKSSEMNAPLQKVMTVANTLNVASIQYHDTHKAGRDLHQARADYRQLLAKVTGKVEKPVSQPGEDPAANATPSADPDHQAALDHVKAAAASVKSAAANAASSAKSGARTMLELVDFAKSALLKKTDIKIMCFALVASQQERQIERVCHDISLGSITASTMSASLAAARAKEKRGEAASLADDDTVDSPAVTPGPRGNPFLPVWFAASDDVPQSSQSLLHPDRVNSLLSTLNTDPLGAARSKLDAAAKTALFGGSFLNVPDIMAPGSTYIGGAFQSPPESVNPADNVPMNVADLMRLGFAKVTGKNPLPAVVSGLVAGVHGEVSDFLAAVYHALVQRPGDAEITKSSLVQAVVPETFADTIATLTVTQLANLITSTSNQYSVASVSGVELGRATAVSEEGSDVAKKIQTAYAESATPVVIAAVRSAMGDLSRQLELARRDAVSTQANVMEWYLGRLPYLHVDLFCSVFFPFWGALMRCLLLAMDGPTATALKSVLDAADKLNNAVQQTIADTNRAVPDTGGGEAGDAFDQATRAGGLRGPLGTGGVDASRVSRFANVDAAKEASNARSLAVMPTLPIIRGKFKLPFTSRVADGQGMEIEDYEDVKANHQWDKALSPDQQDPEDEDESGNKDGAPSSSLAGKMAAAGPKIGAQRG